MCKVRWNAYTNALRRASIARRVAEATPADPEPIAAPEPARAKRGRKPAVAAEA